MKKGLFQFFFLINLFVIYFTSSQASELKGLQFKQVGEIGQLEIILDDEKSVANKISITDSKQIIVDLSNVQAQEKTLRAFDTSEFSGAVVFVSAYKKPGSEKDLRIALQLRDNVRSVINKEGNKFVLSIENRFGAFSKAKLEEEQQFDSNITNAEEGRIHVPKSTQIEDILENLTLSGRKKYVGTKISFNVKDAAVEDILKMIADSSGFNIILTEEIKSLPPLTLSLTNIPWDQALDTVLGLNRLVAKKNGVILLVSSIERATAELQAEIQNKRLAEAQEPLVTKIFPISYAGIDDISIILKEYLTPQRGKIANDQRTNSLILKDTAEVIEKMKKIVELLDTQTPQVLIESRIVEVVESYKKELGLTNGITWGYDPIGQISNSGPLEIGASGSGGSQDVGPGFSFSSAPTESRTALGLAIGRFGRLFNLSMSLQLMESEAKGKIISSPKVITQNKKTATITTSDQTSFANSATSTGTSTTQTVTFQQATASMSLQVTPQVTNEGSIVLDINLTKDQFGERAFTGGPPNKQTRAIQTNVLVDNGSTIVIGGVYNYEKRENHSGVPFLKDIPLLGWLFRTPYNPQTSKNELMIFLTPRIINQEEAGLINRSNNS